jgi:hypothetical protein
MRSAIDAEPLEVEIRLLEVAARKAGSGRSKSKTLPSPRFTKAKFGGYVLVVGVRFREDAEPDLVEGEARRGF